MQSLHAELDVGLDPGSPGSRPGLQVALNRCAPGAADLLGLITELLKKFNDQVDTNLHSTIPETSQELCKY